MSNEWLLTEEEIDNIRFKLTKPTSNDEDWIKQVHLTGSQSIARAQLQKVAIEGEKPCPHDWYPPERKRLRKRQCSYCLASLRQEAGMEGSPDFWQTHAKSKEAHNKRVSSLSFSEKVEMTERLQADCELLDAARERGQFGLGHIPANETCKEVKDA